MEILDYPAEESFRALYLLVSRVSRFLLCPVSVMPCVLRSKLLFRVSSSVSLVVQLLS